MFCRAGIVAEWMAIQLPRMIRHAGKVLRRPHVDLSNFLGHFRKQWISILSRNNPSGYHAEGVLGLDFTDVRRRESSVPR
jgi:hypothetical protein